MANDDPDNVVPLTAAMAVLRQLENPETANLSRLARQIAHDRGRREDHFDAALFADPAWDILLHLFIAGEESRPVSISALCAAAGVPATTALRWIQSMIDKGLIERRTDALDQRRQFVRLAGTTRERMRDYLAAWVPVWIEPELALRSDKSSASASK